MLALHRFQLFGAGTSARDFVANKEVFVPDFTYERSATEFVADNEPRFVTESIRAIGGGPR